MEKQKMKKQEKTIETICSFCGKKLDEVLDRRGSSLLCKKCQKLTPIGANSYLKYHTLPIDNMKGGIKMKKDEKNSLSQEVISFLASKDVAVEDRTKVLSCAYSIAADAKPAKEKVAKPAKKAAKK